MTIVEFSDFQCPFCARVLPTLKQLEAEVQRKVRLVCRDFPLPIHAEAPKAAEAAHCAADQGKFWEMHDRLFANQQRAAGGGPQAPRRTELGLDAGRFNTCVDSGRYAAAWKADMDAGAAAGRERDSDLLRQRPHDYWRRFTADVC